MGDAQSAQREDKKDGAAEGDSGTVDDAPTIEDKCLKNKGQLSEINGKADSSVTEVNGLCEEEIAAEAIRSPDEDISETEELFKEEETLLENVEMNEKESPNEANEDVPLETIEMDAKQNDINESFRRFFSNIGLKLTVKRGSGDIATDETNEDEPNRPEDVEDTAKETTSTNAEQNTAQETYDNDSTTCPTLTDATSEDVLENAEEKRTETKEESDNADAATASPIGEDAHQDATPEEQPRSTSPSSPEEEVVVSPIKRFFTTGIFSGLRKKKKAAEDETPDKELEDLGEKEAVEMTEQTVQDEQQEKEEISIGVEAEHEDNAPAAQTTDATTIIVTEPEIQSSQEKDKVQASPLKRLLSGSSLKRLSKKQRSRRSSDAKLSDSEHVSDQLLSSTESAENQKDEGCAQPSAEAAGEEDGAWASFKKLMTPKKRVKRSSLSNEGTVEEPKPSEGGQISDHSTEEGKKRKDSSVSWDSVLCGSGRRRSRKTSDSEDESPQIDDKQDGGSKHGAESALESSNEGDEILAHSPKQADSPSESDGGSTWKSLKRLVTPKRKAKDEDESKDNVQSDSDVTQDESSFSIKKLLPGRKKRKSAEKQDQVSSDEADKDAASGDEDSDTPAVVPLSEFDTVETEVHIQTQADIESHKPKEADSKLQQDLLDQMLESVPPCDGLPTEAKKDTDDALENKASKTATKNEEPDDSDTESLSKPQLSDIPEEATPASVTEEAARDDTIAEDLVEITSEAITAPEPLDITLADETEMVSAVSQLSSESSKTSGNTTPVPAEYVVMETDALLHQVVENISVSPTAVPVCSDVLGSGPHQILETPVKEDAAILEMDRRLDDFKTAGLNVEELGAATTQTDSTSEVNDSVSTEIVSEIPTEEFATAEIALDEEHKVAHPDESLQEMESIDEIHNLVECLPEENAAVSTDIHPEGDKIVPDESSLVEAHQTETEPPKLDPQGADSAATVADETKDESMEQEVRSLTEKGGQIMHTITNQIEADDKDQPPVEMEKLQAALDTEEGRVQSLEKDIIPEDIPAAETDAYKLKEEIVPLTEVDIEPEKDELHGAKPETVQGPEASEAVQAKEEVKSEDYPPVGTVTDEAKQTAESLTEVSVESENKDLPVNVIKTVKEAVQAPSLDSEEGSGQSPKWREKSEDNPPAETVPDEPKEETTPLTGAKLEPMDASKAEHVQEPEVFKDVQAPTFNSEEGGVQSLEKEAIEDVPEGETVTDQSKEETAVQAPTLDSEEGSVQSPKQEEKSEDNLPAGTVTDEPKEETIPLTGAKIEPVDAAKEPEVFKAVQAPTLNSVEGSDQSLEKEVIEYVPEGETVTDEPKEETASLTEDKLEPVDASKAEHAQEPEILEAVQAPTLDSEEGSVQSSKQEEKSEDNPLAKTVTDEPKEETITVTGAEFEPVDAAKEPEVFKAVQAPTLDSEEGSVQSLEKEAIEYVTDEPKEETTPLTEDKLEPVDASKAEHAQEPEAVQAPTLDSEEGGVQSPKREEKSEDNPPAETVLAEGSVQSLEKGVISEDAPEGETVTDESKEETTSLTGANVEPVDASKIEYVQEPEVLDTVQAPRLDSEEGGVQSLEKKAVSEDVSKGDEPKEETTPLTEAKLEPVDASKAEYVQEPEVLDAVQAPTLDSTEGSVQSLEKEVISENAPQGETVTDEPKEEPTPLTEDKHEPVDVSKEPEVIEAVQAPRLDSEEGGFQSLEKEVISEDAPEAKSVADEPKEETTPQIKVNSEQVDASKTEHAQEPEVIEAVQAPILDSEEGSVQSPKEEEKSEDNPPEETVLDEPKEETIPLTGAKIEPVDVSKEPEIFKAVQAPTLDSEEPKEETTPLTEAKLEPVDASKPEHTQEPEVIEAVQAATLDSEEGSVQSLEKGVISEDAPEANTVADEPKEETTPQQVDTSKTEHAQEPEVLEAVQKPTLDSEEGSVQTVKEEVQSEDTPSAETVADEPKEETSPPIKVNLEQVDASKTEHVQEPEELEVVQAATLHSEVGCLPSVEKKGILENIPAVETRTDEPKQETEVTPEEKLPAQAAETEHSQEPEVLEAVQAASLDSEVLLSGEKEVIPDDTPAVDTVTDEPKQETEVDPEEKVPVEAKEPEVLPSDVKDIVTETKTDEGTSTYAHVVTESIEGGSAQELAKQILLEDVPTPDVASVTDGHESEVVAQPDRSLEIAKDQTESIPQDVEQEECIPEAVKELQTLKSVNEEASNVQVLEKTGETPAPCADNAAATEGPKHELESRVEAEKESELPATEVTTAGIEHAIVTQVVVCNLKDVSAAIPDVLIETTSPSNEPLIERAAGELVVKEEVETAAPLVKDDVSETAKEGSVVMMMHAPSVEFEDDHRIQVQVVADDVKSAETVVDTVLEVGVTEAKEVIDVCHETAEIVENLSATPEIEEETINEENKVTVQEVVQHVKVTESVVVNLEKEVEEEDAVTAVSEMVESESNEVEDQKVMEERQDEAPTVISDVSATELMQTPDIPGSLDVSIHDRKDDLEKTEREKSACVAVEEAKSNLIIHEEAQVIPSPTVTPSNAELDASQNTGIISTGIVETPSSLSNESPTSTTEIFEAVKKTDVSEVEVQAAAAGEPVETNKLMEVAVQAAETTDSMERAVIMAQPVLLDVNVQVMETVEPVEQIKSTERVTPSVQLPETVEPVRQTEKREVFMSPPVLSEACDRETKTDVKQKEDEQDVWMDAEEDIDAQEKTEVSLVEVEESLQPQTESEQKEKTRLEREVPKAKNEEQQETYKTARTCEIDSEGEDFAVALEHPETETASVATTERD